MFVHSLAPDEVVLGGSAADELEALPERARRGANENAFLGGFALWNDAALARSGS
jgi:polyphosphate glucokinase